MNQKPRGEKGYALIAAVVSIVIFALMALAIINATRSSAIMASAEIERARLLAAADAGVALAVHGLQLKDPSRRWAIDGKVRRETFEAITLDIFIEDERGKIALNLINKSEVAKMFGEFGLTGTQQETAVDGFMDWRDEDDDPRPRGAEFETYRSKRIKPRNGELRSVGELALISGVGVELAKRIAPFATVNFGSGEFDPRFASQIAIRVSTDALDASEFFERGAPLGGGAGVRARRPELSISLVGRPLTIRVEARHPPDARATRKIIVELTGSEVRPYVVRARE